MQLWANILKLFYGRSLLMGDATTTNMPVYFDYFCDFIDIFDYGPACIRGHKWKSGEYQDATQQKQLQQRCGRCSLGRTRSGHIIGLVLVLVKTRFEK
ncbi:hypothetical protein TNCV_1991411 [Trichonephila clavipes]|nr:hypothetical protein TNCV_1991411 [Trichonephila clavipes]